MDALCGEREKTVAAEYLYMVVLLLVRLKKVGSDLLVLANA